MDVSVEIRVECIRRAKAFLQYHPDLTADLTGELWSVRESWAPVWHVDLMVGYVMV